MNILVTGCLGHIGSGLIRRLYGHNVIGVDNFLTQRYCSLANLPSNVTFIQADVTSIPERLLSNIDAVIHLAAITDASSSFANKDQIETTNVVATKGFIDLCERIGVKLFVFASSTSVYGVATEVVNEDEKYVNPQSPYAESKLSIERYLRSYKHNHLIFRFGTIFGVTPGIRFHTAINKMCFQASFGQPLSVWRQNYDQHRPYLGISDAMSAIELGLGLNSDKLNTVYNVVSENRKLLDIVGDIKSNSIKDVTVNMVDTPLLNQYSYYVNSDKIRKIGFESYDTVLFDGIRPTLRMFNNLKPYSPK